MAPVLLTALVVACDSGRSPSAPTPPTAAQQVPPQPVPPPPPPKLPTFGPRYLTPPEPPPSSSVDAVVGRYWLDLAIGPDCTGIPADARARRYVADIDADRRGPYDYSVKLYAATFLEAFGCNEPRWPGTDYICHQFLASGSANGLHFDIYPEPDGNFSGNTIQELIGPDAWLGLAGEADGRMDGSTITATGITFVDRWTDGFARYTTCSSEPIVPPSSLRLTFTRQ